MDKEIGIEEARKTLGDLANQVHYQGGRIILTRKGKPIADIVPHTPQGDDDE
ncbi:type II toxin-antitoxin system prevent-host-death family antitoxin [Phytomonospora sp. NPDC050363]|uniref:type II toxin-antitoxin system Phd/YefM family antitoxin n=1 Tax=Phytomonospora sp. NPDC050363 TaxID=3155642 RepID=UPI0033FC6062